MTTTRDVSAHLDATVSETAELVLSIAVSEGTPCAAEEFTATLDGSPVPVEMIVAAHGTRLHVLRRVGPGALVVDYRATVTGSDPRVEVPAGAAADRIVYLRPSRYCESDTLAAVAGAQFHDLAGKDLLDAVSSWVGRRLTYVSGSSRPTDGAVQTYLARAGVCRDFAHLVIAQLRARGMPARLVSVYAPGLSPMDFHAVAEAWVDDDWYVVDATTLAPRAGMVRIATGRDASDTAFLTVQSGRCELTSMEVTATIAPGLPGDDVTTLVRLA